MFIIISFTKSKIVWVTYDVLTCPQDGVCETPVAQLPQTRISIPPEMYIYSSDGMIEFIIPVLNNLKLHSWNPDQWDNMAITTIYKRVRPKKILRNHRGIFLTGNFKDVRTTQLSQNKQYHRNNGQMSSGCKTK